MGRLNDPMDKRVLPEEAKCETCRQRLYRFHREGAWTGWEHSIEPSGHRPLALHGSVKTITSIHFDRGTQ